MSVTGKGIPCAVACLFISASCAFAAIDFGDIEFWTGSGSNQAALVINWSSPVDFEIGNSGVDTTTLPPVANVSHAWGYRFDGTAPASDMIGAILAADSRLYMLDTLEFGSSTLLGLGFNFDGDNDFGITNGTTTFNSGDFANGVATVASTSEGDGFNPTDSGDLWWSGWNGPNWGTWSEQGQAGGFTTIPDRGAGFATYNSGTFSFTHGEWEGNWGLGFTTLSDGSWFGLTVSPARFLFGGDNTIFETQNLAPPFDATLPASALIPEPSTLALVCACLWLFPRRRRNG